MKKEDNKLSLIVSNVKTLQPGLLASHAFDVDGGIVGSSDNSNWVLYDDGHHIKSKHFEIFHIDNSYCLRDLCGTTYINDSDMPLGVGNEARLQHKDRIRIGTYYLLVKLTDDDELNDHSSLEQFINKSKNELLDDHYPDIVNPDDVLENKKLDGVDPIKELDGNGRLNDEDNDPLDNVLDEFINQGSKKEKTDFTPQADSEFELTSSMRLKKILGFGRRKKAVLNSDEDIDAKDNTDITLNTPQMIEGFNMDDNNLEILEQELAQQSRPEPSFEGSNHLIMGPLLNGLEVQLENSANIENIHKLGEEFGESLKACIQGILGIHSQVEHGRFGVINRNLQPIEDNPLRLGLNYNETMKTMFDSKKSMVHLSPPAAIEESLKNIRNHNQAMQEATSEALQHILMAFSPDVLLKRFNSYKRSSDAETTSSESWAWGMYQNYFSELTSNRQRGFDKLFWEIFEQSYDRKIREMQLEK